MVGEELSGLVVRVGRGSVVVRFWCGERNAERIVKDCEANRTLREAKEGRGLSLRTTGLSVKCSETWNAMDRCEG